MSPRTRSQTAVERSKRARDPSPERVRPSKRSKPAYDQLQCVLFSYPFVLPLVSSFLFDFDASFLMKPIMSQFILYRDVPQALADEMIDPSRMSYFQVSYIKSATHGDLRKHRHLKFLLFDDKFNSPLQPGCFGVRLRSVTFGDDFNQPVDGILPEGLHELCFNKSFNQPIAPFSLPSSITCLSFTGDFNQPFRIGALPSSLKTLILSRKFNLPILPGVLPPNLTNLYFVGVTDQPLLPGALPSSLRSLELGVMCDHPIGQGVLPHGLTYLTLSVLFNQPLAVNVIPNSVTHLTFGVGFSQVLLPGVIPSSVIQLQLGGDYEEPLLPNSLPNSIKHLIFCCNNTELLHVGLLPNSVEHMEIGYVDSPEDDHDDPLILLPSMFPSSVTQLTLHRKFEVDTVLPSTITKLVFGPQFNEQIPVNLIPSSVTHLRFGDIFAQSLTSEMLPSSLNYLILGKSFEARMLASFPRQLTHLCFQKPMPFAEVNYLVENLPRSTIHMVIDVKEDSLPFIVRTYVRRSSEAGKGKVYTSLQTIDIENIDHAKLRDWTMSDSVVS